MVAQKLALTKDRQEKKNIVQNLIIYAALKKKRVFAS